MSKKYVAIDVHSAMCMIEVENEKRKKLLQPARGSSPCLETLVKTEICE